MQQRAAHFTVVGWTRAAWTGYEVNREAGYRAPASSCGTVGCVAQIPAATRLNRRFYINRRYSDRGPGTRPP